MTIRDSAQLNGMLSERGVSVTKITPNPESDVDFFLALDIFDSTEFEERTLDEWQALMPLPCPVFMVSMNFAISEMFLKLNNVAFWMKPKRDYHN